MVWNKLLAENYRFKRSKQEEEEGKLSSASSRRRNQEIFVCAYQIQWDNDRCSILLLYRLGNIL